MVIANELTFTHTLAHGDWLIGPDTREVPLHETLLSGTTVLMELSLDSGRTMKEVYDMFANPELDDYSFSKTHVPLTLAKLGSGPLTSRSVAKRVLSRVEGFREVLLDFSGIDWIGQGFADEIFRVFQRAHPDVKIIALYANDAVRQMINRALSHDADHAGDGHKAEA